MNNSLILDTTLRDGSYVANFQMSAQETAVIAGQLDTAGKAIVVNHTFGISLSEVEVVKLKSLGIPLIEGCAHFITNQQKDLTLSNYFNASIYLFNAIKLLATGEGGAVVTDNNKLYEVLTVNQLDQGISDLTAALGISQLTRYNTFLSFREKIAFLYFEQLGDVAKTLLSYDSIYYRFPIFVANDKNFLSSKKVSYRKGVDFLLHRKFYYDDSGFANACEVVQKKISISIYPQLKRSEVDIIVEETKRLYDAD